MRARAHVGVRTLTLDRIVTICVPRAVSDEVRRLAEREAETQSTIFRRLIRSGLRVEVRSQGAER